MINLSMKSTLIEVMFEAYVNLNYQFVRLKVEFRSSYSQLAKKHVEYMNGSSSHRNWKSL